jgi:SAM-dependent methyltransferase
VTDPLIDTTVLRSQYSSTAPLAARQQLWRYRTGPTLAETALDLAGLFGTEVVVDVGCGNGVYLAELRRRRHDGPVLGLDLSAGMARASRTYAATAAADAQALPLGDARVDLALCMHMLYHVPDPARAIGELRRVVRPGGMAMVATNGAGHTAEATALITTAVRRVTGAGPEPTWQTGGTGFETGLARTMLSAAFDEVEVHQVGGAAPVPDPAVISGYFASWPPEAIGLSAGPVWDAILAEADRLVAAHFADQPVFTITSRASVLIGR